MNHSINPATAANIETRLNALPTELNPTAPFAVVLEEAAGAEATVPVPVAATVTNPLWEGAEVTDPATPGKELVAEATPGKESVTGATPATLPVEEVLEADAVPPMAAAWNCSKVLSAVGFTANTIPAVQWTAGTVWAQKNHKGVVSVTWNVHTGSAVSVALTGWKPESIPVGDRTQGAAKVDWVTEWFLFWLVSEAQHYTINRWEGDAQLKVDVVTGLSSDLRRIEDQLCKRWAEALLYKLSNSNQAYLVVGTNVDLDISRRGSEGGNKSEDSNRQHNNVAELVYWRENAIEPKKWWV